MEACLEENQKPSVDAPATSVITIEKKVPQPLEANEKGQLVGATLEEQYRIATAYYKSGLMPQGLNSPEKVLVAVQLCRELGLPPMSSIGKIAVINGTPSLFGDLPLALVMKSRLLEAIQEDVEMDKEGKDPVRATCAVKRKGLENVIERTFTQEDAKRAGLWGKKVWAPYPKRMMQMRARSHALKDAFADVLSGVSILEYEYNPTVDVSGGFVSADKKSIAEELNEAYVPEEKADQGQEGTR